MKAEFNGWVRQAYVHGGEMMDGTSSVYWVELEIESTDDWPAPQIEMRHRIHATDEMYEQVRDMMLDGTREVAVRVDGEAVEIEPIPAPHIAKPMTPDKSERERMKALDKARAKLRERRGGDDE